VGERLASPNERTRWAAVSVLESLRRLDERVGSAAPATAASAVPAIAALLGSPSPVVRLTAVEALARTGDAATPTLIGCLTDEDPQVREAALGALGRPKGLEYILRPILDALRSGDPERQSRAMTTVFDELCWQPQDLLSGDERKRLLDVIDEVARELGRLVEEGSPDLRWEAAQTLRLIEPLGAPGVPALVAALGSDDSRLRAEAADGLGWIGVADDYVIDALVPLLDAQLDELQDNARVSLGRLGAGNPRAVAALIPRLTAPSVVVRRRAADALGMCGVGGRPAAPGLTAALGDTDAEVRAAAARSLASVTKGTTDGVAPLVQALDDPQQPVRIAAARGLGELGPNAGEAVSAMVALFEASRVAAADESLGEERAREFLDVCYEVMSAFGEMGEAAIPALVDIVVGPDEHLAGHAAAAFRLETDVAEAALAQHLAGSAETRLRAAEGFERLAYNLTGLGPPERSPGGWDAEERRHLDAMMARHPALAEAVCLRHMHNLCARETSWTDELGAGITLDRFWFVDLIGLEEPYVLEPKDACCPLAGDDTLGYALNRALAWQAVSRIDRPAETALFFEADVDDGEPLGGPEDAVARHDGRVVVGFCDGHVDTLPLDAARALLQRPVP